MIVQYGDRSERFLRTVTRRSIRGINAKIAAHLEEHRIPRPRALESPDHEPQGRRTRGARRLGSGTPDGGFARSRRVASTKALRRQFRVQGVERAERANEFFRAPLELCAVVQDDVELASRASESFDCPGYQGRLGIQGPPTPIRFDPNRPDASRLHQARFGPNGRVAFEQTFDHRSTEPQLIRRPQRSLERARILPQTKDDVGCGICDPRGYPRPCTLDVGVRSSRTMEPAPGPAAKPAISSSRAAAANALEQR